MPSVSSSKCDIKNTMFSIEQIELIRRLRNSGITKEQVIEAFESLDRIDGELGTLYNYPVNKAVRQHENMGNRQHGGSSQHSYMENHSLIPQQTLRQYNGTHLTEQVMALPKLKNVISQHPASEFNSSVKKALPSHKEMESLNPRQIIQQRTTSTDHTKTTSSCSVSDSLTTLDTNNIQNSTRQTPDKISMITRQKKHSTETDHFYHEQEQIQSLRQSIFNDGSPSKKPRITETIDLVETESNQEEANLVESAVKARINAAENRSPSGTEGMRLVVHDGQEVMVSYQRRERFTFREKHLEVLESCFKENPYPSYEQRETIANLCNVASSNNGARKLHDKEKVTAHMVLNWFANSRKEVKRLAKEGGVVASASILPSRLNKNKPLLVDGVIIQQSADECVISDKSNDSFQTSSDENGKNDDFIIIKCEQEPKG